LIKREHRLNYDHVRGAHGESTEVLLARYSEDPRLRYAEPNYIVALQATIPNDSFFLSEQWALYNTGQSGGTAGADIDAPRAWDLQRGSSGLTVAVVDTGIKYDHPDLAQNIWSNPGEANCTDGVDNDGDGYIDDCRGWDFVNGDNNPMDDYGHGTHVAGIIGARGNNALGIAGVAWTIQLMPIKVFASNGLAQDNWIVPGIMYAVDRGARIINYSAAFPAPSQAQNDAVRYAHDHGVLFVCAAGTGGTNNDTSHWFPCYTDHYVDLAHPWLDYRDLTNIICVTSTDRSDSKEGVADYGPVSVDLGAPGVDIRPTALPGGAECVSNPLEGGLYALCTGTSMATPHVAGAAALLASQRPGATVSQLKWPLLTGIDSIPALAGITATGGRLNAYGALTAAADTTPPSAPTGLSATYGGAAASLAWTASTDNVGVHHYEIIRSSSVSGAYKLVGYANTTSFADGGLATGATYLYKVRAVDAAGNVSANSNLDIATTYLFATDPSLAPGVVVKANHINELRTAIGYVRSAASLAVYPWTDVPVTVGMIVKDYHINQLRTAVDQARSALGLSTGGFTDNPVTGAPPNPTRVKAVHITELRNRTQ
jgi:subtilisin family serine protease